MVAPLRAVFLRKMFPPDPFRSTKFALVALVAMLCSTRLPDPRFVILMPSKLKDEVQPCIRLRFPSRRKPADPTGIALDRVAKQWSIEFPWFALNPIVHSFAVQFTIATPYLIKEAIDSLYDPTTGARLSVWPGYTPSATEPGTDRMVLGEVTVGDCEVGVGVDR